MKIFVSSTFEDLKDYREAAIRVLRQMGHEVIAMEDFTASSAPPVERVLKLVSTCEAYIGIFAWRYGFMPEPADISPTVMPMLPDGFVSGKTSITHLEYLQAQKSGAEILAFLLDETTPWPPHKIDAYTQTFEQTAHNEADREPPGKSIRDLRQALKRARIISFFTSPSDLEARVAAAVTNLGLTTKFARNLESLTSPVPAPVADSSVTWAIQGEIRQAQSTLQRTVTVNLAETWWASRLYLLAELAKRFTQISRIVLVKMHPDQDEFIGMLSVATTLERLALLDPRLETFSAQLPGVLGRIQDLDAALDSALVLWDQTVPDAQQHVTVTAPNLDLWFGDSLLREPVKVTDLSKVTLLDIGRILSYPNDFVPVESDPQAMKELREISPGPISPTAQPSPPAAGQTPSASAVPIAVVHKRALNDQLAQLYIDELMERARLK
ncbi:hypothetical protein GCM10027053_12630 [Intrasporangium mesophilum]